MPGPIKNSRPILALLDTTPVSSSHAGALTQLTAPPSPPGLSATPPQPERMPAWMEMYFSHAQPPVTHHLQRANTIGTYVPRQGTPALEEKSVFDLRNAQLSKRYKTEGVSSHAAVYVTTGRADIRTKFNHYGPVSTFNEVFSARLKKKIFKKMFAQDPSKKNFVDRCSPDVRFAAHTEHLETLGYIPHGGYIKVGIASKMVAGFTDWGDFLVRERAEPGQVQSEKDCQALEHVTPQNRQAYLELLNQFDEYRTKRQQTAEDMYVDDPELRELILNAKRDYRAEDPELLAHLQVLRDMDDAALGLLDQMLELLPPKFKSVLKIALFEADAVGNGDFANHERANVGLVVVDGILLGATCIDFGVAGPNTFKGKHRNVNDETPELRQNKIDDITRPARVDDLNLKTAIPEGGEPEMETDMNGVVTVKEKEYQAFYLQADIDPAFLDFTHVHKDHRVTDGMPRSGSYAALLAGDETAPQEMRDVAHILSMFSRAELKEFTREIFAECEESDDPNIVDMINHVKAKGHTEEKLVQIYSERFRKIIDRADLPGENPFQIEMPGAYPREQ